MSVWEVLMTQPDQYDGTRTVVEIVRALDANHAARLAQRVMSGWTAVLAVRLS